MKILDLFNEYNLSPEMTGGEMEQPRTEKDWNTMSRIYKAYIVSKDFGWIKWLVDNDKIDKEFEDKKFLGDIFDSGYRYNNSFIEERLLCYLALTDEPIEFLISILK